MENLRKGREDGWKGKAIAYIVQVFQIKKIIFLFTVQHKTYSSQLITPYLFLKIDWKSLPPKKKKVRLKTLKQI